MNPKGWEALAVLEEVNKMNDTPFLRPEVAQFAQIMEKRLRENDYKGGWKDCGINYLLTRALQELGELVMALGASSNRIALIAKETADVANFCMMIADVVGGLEDDGSR